MLLPVTMSTVMNNNKNKATMKETSKNCVSDYPLSNTESAERGVKRGILRNRNGAVADVRSVEVRRAAGSVIP
jgi:hypothetical protein